MKGTSRLRLKPALSIMLIAVIAALMINRIVYTHIHVLSNGTLVSHAHPFSKNTESNSGTSHQHSNIELFLLDQLDILMLFVSASIILKQFSRSGRYNEPAPGPHLTAFVPISPGRAPPACI